MSLIISTPDALRQSVESATGGRNTILYDDKGLPSVMVVVPRFRIEDLEPALGTGVHPAFVVDGAEKSEIFIGKFPAVVLDDRALSLPGEDPQWATGPGDVARNLCKAKGPGWHVMTAHEWAAVALWCIVADHQPTGNTGFGRSHTATWQNGRRADGALPGVTSPAVARTITGSGPVHWTHDGSPAGITDVVGNVMEWVDLVQLRDGQIFTTGDNNYRALEADWVASGTFFDSPSAGDGAGTASLGPPTLAGSVTNYGHTNPSSGALADYNQAANWRDIATSGGHTPAQLLQQLLLAPWPDMRPVGAAKIRNYGTRYISRGGSWTSGSEAGMAYLGADGELSLGFRVAWIG